jgi:O-antigen/teichoic acid export membrane protein
MIERFLRSVGWTDTRSPSTSNSVSSLENDQRNSSYSRSRWLSGSLWLGGANASSLGATVIVGVLLARKLGPSGLGVYSAVTVATMFMSLLVTFRLELHLLTLLRNDEIDRAAYFSVLRAAYLLVLPTCVVGEAIALLVIHGPISTPLAIDIMEVALAPLLFRRVVLQVRTQMGRLALSQSIGRVAWVTAVVVLVVINPPDLILWVIVARVTALVVEIVILTLMAPFARAVTHEPSSRVQPVMTVLRQSLFLMASGLAGTGFNRLDQLILTGVKGSTPTGTYAAGVRLAELPGIIAPIVQNVSTPGLLELHRRGERRELEEALIDSLLLMLVPAGLAVATLVVFPATIIRLLYGPQFGGAVPIVVVLAMAEWITLPATTFTSVALAVDCRSNFFGATIIGFAVSLALDVTLIPHFGGLGAAWASLAGYATATVGHGLWGSDVRRIVRVTILPLTKASGGLALAIGIGYAPAISSGGRMALMVIAYFAACWFIHPASSRRLWRGAISVLSARNVKSTQ